MTPTRTEAGVLGVGALALATLGVGVGALGVGVVGLFDLGCIGVVGSRVIGGLGCRRQHDRLGCDEQRHVDGLGLGGRCLQHQPGFRLLGKRLGGGQQVTDPHGLLAVDAGVRAAGAAVEFDQGVEHLAAGGAQHPGQRMHPQPLGQLGFRGCRSQLTTDCGGVVGVVGCEVIVVHVGSFDPRARRLDAAARGPRYEPGTSRTGFVVVSPRVALVKPARCLGRVKTAAARAAPPKRWSRSFRSSLRLAPPARISGRDVHL